MLTLILIKINFKQATLKMCFFLENSFIERLILISANPEILGLRG